LKIKGNKTEQNQRQKDHFFGSFLGAVNGAFFHRKGILIEEVLWQLRELFVNLIVGCLMN